MLSIHREQSHPSPLKSPLSIVVPNRLTLLLCGICRLQNTDLWANMEQEDDGCWTVPWAFERRQTDREGGTAFLGTGTENIEQDGTREGPAGRTGVSKEVDAEASGPIFSPNCQWAGLSRNPLTIYPTLKSAQASLRGMMTGKEGEDMGRLADESPPQEGELT